MAREPDTGTELGSAALRFGLVFAGGLGWGALIGWLFLALIRRISSPYQCMLATLICAYTAYLAAEIWLQVSGVMAVLTAGLMLGTELQKPTSRQESHFVHQAWDFMAFTVSALVFLLVGVTVTLSMFEERWLAMLIGIGGVLVARAVGIYLGLPIIGLLPGVKQLPLADKNLLFWGGMRGAVTLALALSLPLELDYWWTVQSIAFGVVLFSLFMQGPSLPLLIKRAGN